jgi:hypothetical protein
VVDAIRADVGVEESGRSEKGIGEEIGGEEDEMVGATRWQKAAKRKKKLMEEQALKEGQTPIVEGQTSGEKLEAEDPEMKAAEKPISRAERRRRIKEQILAEGEGEGFKGYKRRMW